MNLEMNFDRSNNEISMLSSENSNLKEITCEQIRTIENLKEDNEQLKSDLELMNDVSQEMDTQYAKLE